MQLASALLHKVRELEIDSRFVVLTAQESDRAEAATLGLGVSGFLREPIGLVDLVERCQATLHSPTTDQLGPQRPFAAMQTEGISDSLHAGTDNHTTTKDSTMNIHQSAQAIMRRTEIVADLFYVKYLDRYPQVRQYFEGVEMQHQAVLLKMALTIIQQYYEHRYPAAEQYLLVLGHRHRVRQVPEDLYSDWRDSMLDTLEQFHGAEWSEGLKAEWAAAINLAAATMHRGYNSANSVRTETGGQDEV